MSRLRLKSGPAEQQVGQQLVPNVDPQAADFLSETSCWTHLINRSRKT